MGRMAPRGRIRKPVSHQSHLSHCQRAACLTTAWLLAVCCLHRCEVFAAEPAGLIEMLGPPDPYWGTVADRPEPGRNPQSLYRGLPLDSHTTFEVGNNATLAAIHPRGGLIA